MYQNLEDIATLVTVDSTILVNKKLVIIIVTASFFLLAGVSYGAYYFGRMSAISDHTRNQGTSPQPTGLWNPTNMPFSPTPYQTITHIPGSPYPTFTVAPTIPQISQAAPENSQKVWPTQAECENATGKKCVYYTINCFRAPCPESGWISQDY